MNLLFKSLLSKIGELAEEKGIRSFRVDHKRNARGDLVVALIILDRDGPFGPEAISGAAPTSRPAKRP